MMRLVGIIVAATFVVLIFFTGLVMLVSPRRWFELPSYLAFRGTIRESMLETRAGRLQIRVLGLLLVLFTSWMSYSILSGVVR